MRDPEKTRARRARYRRKKKIERFGIEFADVDMRGRHGNHARGRVNARGNHGLAMHDDGYLKVQVGAEHPLADPNGYAYLHRLVWAASSGQTLSRSDIIHHRDGDKTNNRLSNLQVMTNSEHSRHHMREYRQGDIPDHLWQIKEIPA